MKGKTKKTVALLMVFVMIFSLGITALAEGDLTSIPSSYSEEGNNEDPSGEETTAPGQGDANEEGGEDEEEAIGNGGGEEGDADDGEGDVLEEDEGEEASTMRAYEILYLLEEIEEEIHKPVRDIAQIGEVIEIPHPEIKGYQVLPEQPEELVVSEDEEENAVVVYYEEIVSDDDEEEVIEEEIVGAIELIDEETGVSIYAESGVLPLGAILNVVQISQEETQEYLDELSENEGIELREALAFDITLLDEEGNEIQPEGEVTVSFSDIEFEEETEEVLVYHVVPEEEQEENSDETYSINRFRNSRREFKAKSAQLFKNKGSKFNKGLVKFKTDHFSIYIVGTGAIHDQSNNRYQMVRGETIELEERDKNSGGKWSVSSGSSVQIINDTNTSGNIKATIKAVGTGNATIRYRLNNSSNSSKNSYFYINVTAPGNIDSITDAPTQNTEEGQLEPGKIAAHKYARWYNYSDRIAEITLTVEGRPSIVGSDVILVLDKSGSMKNKPSGTSKTRMELAQEASNKFITEMLGNGNPLNNRVALIPFSAYTDSGGAGNNEVNYATTGRVNFSTNLNLLSTHVNGTIAEGGTNFSAALKKAIDFANSRKSVEKSRPLYIVFMSDGDPGWSGGKSDKVAWNGVDQANTLKGNSYNATIYTIGMALSTNSAGATALKAISSTKNNQVLYKSAYDMNDLEHVLKTIAGELKIAGTEAYFKDYISKYFEYDQALNPTTYIYNEHEHSVKVPVGDILEEGNEFKILVRLKDNYKFEEFEYPTNENIKPEETTNIELNYTDVDGNPDKTIRNPVIEGPLVSVGFGTIDIIYILANDNGDYLDEYGNITNNPAFYVEIGEEGYKYNGIRELEINQTYDVEAKNPPSGYKLYSDDASPKSVYIDEDGDWNIKVKFRVVACPNYTVTFDANGGEDADPASKEVTYGEAYGDLATTSKEGYTFAGWYTAATGGTEIVAESIVSTVGNHTLYAHWTAGGYTVIFDANGGEDADPASKEVTYGEAYGDLATTSKEGYTFAGWYTAATGGTEIVVESIVSTVGNHTLYAHWTAGGYTVIFDANGGEDADPASKEVTYGEAYGDLATTSKEGYTFAGWYTAATGGTEIVAESTVSTVGNHTLYAHWTADPYDVYYHGNDGLTADGDSLIEDPNNPYICEGEVIVISNPFVREGYTFIGWLGQEPSEIYLTALAYLEEPEYIQPGDKFNMPAYNVTFYAQWKLNEYEIKYVAGSNGTLAGGDLTVTKKHFENYPDAPKPVANSGYRFDKWTPNLPVKDDLVTGSITFTANFVRISTPPVRPPSGGGGGGSSRPRDPEIVVVPEEEIPADLPKLNKAEHFQYIQGYTDGTVRPEGNITRDEVAAVFFRLLDAEYRDSIRTTEHKFSDVAPERWSNIHIATLANGGIITGYTDGTFKPGNYITRSEMATIASRFDKLSPFEKDSFSDIEGHWANKYINSAVQKGWIKGYNDGTFKPDQYITRAEFVTLVNNVLERRVTRSEILPDAKQFPDLSEDKWYYEAMQEAVNSHHYERLENGYETWTEIYYPELEM